MSAPAEGVPRPGYDFVEGLLQDLRFGVTAERHDILLALVAFYTPKATDDLFAPATTHPLAGR